MEYVALSGFANYYREFVPNFADIAAPMVALTKKNASFQWTPDCEKAFCALKDCLISAPLLVQWDPEKPTIVETDSSGYAHWGSPHARGCGG